ncbi:MAG: hypothetical protein R2838_00165 [Caldilineaceae bacterium]
MANRSGLRLEIATMSALHRAQLRYMGINGVDMSAMMPTRKGSPARISLLLSILCYVAVSLSSTPEAAAEPVRVWTAAR